MGKKVPPQHSPFTLLENWAVDHEAAKGYKKCIEQLVNEETEWNQRLKHLEDLWGRRRRYLVTELHALNENIQKDDEDLELLLTPKVEKPLPPGPSSLWWLDTTASTWVCYSVIFVNVVTIGLEVWYPSLADNLWAFDQLFILFYTVEVVLRLIFHQWEFVIGSFSVVWWNWLDCAVVVVGVVDQWLLPCFRRMGIFDSDLSQYNLHLNAFRGIRFLRCFRIMRILSCFKIVLELQHTDFSWTETPQFHTFITCVIVLNSLMLGLELDLHSDVLLWTEEAILVIYSFELFVRFKRWGWDFFVHPEDWAWNYFDFVIVIAGVFEQWVLPTCGVMQSLVLGQKIHITRPAGSLLPLFRMMRLLRVLRLLRLLKLCKPLYKLSIGILEAMHSMHWVLLFTAIILYACGILYRSVVGCGILLTGHQDAARDFNSVPQSMFHLFRLMNGLTPSDPLLSSTPLRLLYAFFLVISNWAVLSILTAVVCDNMIVSTLLHEEDEKKENRKLDDAEKKDRLRDIFAQLDTDQNGYLSECEFYALLANVDLADELRKASSLTFRDLHDLFNFLSVQGSDGKWRINCTDFIDKLQCEGKDVSERTLFRVEKQFKLLEQGVDRKFDKVRKISKLSLARAAPRGNRGRALTI